MARTFYLIGAIIAFIPAFIYFQMVTAASQVQLEYKLRLQPGVGVISRGTVLTAEMMQSVSMPASVAADMPWAVDDDAAGVTRSALIGRRFMRDVREGSFIEEDFFRDAPSKMLEMAISPGMRAYAIRLDEAASVGNRVAPDSRVDIFGFLETEDGETAIETVILENVRVLAAGRLESREAFRAEGDANYSVVTLELSPEQISSFVRARDRLRGSLSLALRNPCDGQGAEALAGCAGRTQDG